MNSQTYVVQINDQPVIVRAEVPDSQSVRVSDNNFGIARITGGVPGPQGPPGASEAGLLEAHINNSTPHPAYDVDIPSLTLIFENGIV